MKDNLYEEILKKLILKMTRVYYDVHHNKKDSYVDGNKINYAGRVFDDDEVVSLVDSSLDFWLTTGRYAEMFEEGLANYLGVKYVSLVNSGSSANLIALMTLTSPKLGEKRINKGDEVITVAAGFPTTVAPIIQFGAVPVFVDVEIPGYNIDTSKLEEAYSSKTKAVFLAHTLGNSLNLKAVKAFCDKHKLWLIEDNCDALGTKYFIDGRWKKTGTIGHIGTSSFYPAHHITTGEGGAVYTNDSTLKRIIDSFRDWGRDCHCTPSRDNSCGNRFSFKFGELPEGYDHKYVYSHFGYNLKMTDMQAAIGYAQLKKLPYFVKKRRLNHRILVEGFNELDEYFILPRSERNSKPSWFGFTLTIRDGVSFTREELINHLESKGIQTRNIFAGNIVKQPCFDEMRATQKGFRIVGELKNTDKIMTDSFFLGVYPGLTEDMLRYIIKTVKEFLR